MEYNFFHIFHIRFLFSFPFLQLHQPTEGIDTFVFNQSLFTVTSLSISSHVCETPLLCCCQLSFQCLTDVTSPSSTPSTVSCLTCPSTELIRKPVPDPVQPDVRLGVCSTTTVCTCSTIYFIEYKQLIKSVFWPIHAFFWHAQCNLNKVQFLIKVS